MFKRIKKWWKELTWYEKQKYKIWPVHFFISSLLIFLIVWFSVK